MEKFENLSAEFRNSLEKWAEENLESMGIYKNKSPEFEKLKKQAIGSLRSIYSDRAINIFLRTKDKRKIDSPDGFARITGPCGDTMEMFFNVSKEKIVDSSFQTDGCMPSVVSGGMVAEMVKGKSLDEVGNYTQQDVLDSLGGLPEENKHCALLAINTMKEAIKNFHEKHKD